MPCFSTTKRFIRILLLQETVESEMAPERQRGSNDSNDMKVKERLTL